MTNNNLGYRLLFGTGMCFSVRFGAVQWDWMRSVMYGFAIIGLMYVQGEIRDMIKQGKGRRR